jgi:hypothetical protein
MAKKNYVTLLNAALQAGRSASKERGLGCGRVYVCIVESEDAKGIAKAAKTLGRLFQKKGYAGMTNVLYVGYDNSDGLALGQGTAIAESLKASGVRCYRDEQGD